MRSELLSLPLAVCDLSKEALNSQGKSASGQESTQALNGYEVAILAILVFYRM